MYHELTYQEVRLRRKRLLGIAVAVLLAVACAWAAYSFAKTLAREQGAVALREAVVRSALQCCAVEGSYPTTVAHLVDHYGLVINDQDYRVSYEWLGDNIPPSVVVRVR